MVINIASTIYIIIYIMTTIPIHNAHLETFHLKLQDNYVETCSKL